MLTVLKRMATPGMGWPFYYLNEARLFRVDTVQVHALFWAEFSYPEVELLAQVQSLV